MARLGDEPLQKPFAIAEGGDSLAAAFQHFVFQFLRPKDRTHSAPTAAPGRLQHQGITDIVRHLGDRSHIIRQDVRRRHDWNARRDCGVAGRGFVAQKAHGFRLGADESDARRLTSIDEIGVFGQ